MSSGGACTSEEVMLGAKEARDQAWKSSALIRYVDRQPPAAQIGNASSSTTTRSRRDIMRFKSSIRNITTLTSSSPLQLVGSGTDQML